VGAIQGRTVSELLTISGLRVCYGNLVAIDDLDLLVPPGELFVLLGGSGSGKSTLLRTIAGFVPPEAGHIGLNGADLTALPPHRRPVNMMFQSYALFPHMSVAANIAFGLRMQGMSRAATAARVHEMLELVRLQGFEARRPMQLSGGQQQRVALARSLAPRPALLLLDEPLSALDRNLRRDTREELVRLQHDLSLAFILVTHDQEEALTMADRIGVMHAGRLIQVGSPAEVYEHPATRFVAEFLGAANLLPVTVRHGRAELTCGLAVQAGMDVPSDARWLAVRPERVRIGEATAPNQIAGVVVQRSYAGETLTHVVRLEDGTLMRATMALQEGLAAELVTVGDAVTVSWQPNACILLRQ
jgi:putrescine transport system ATP-binding protein